MQELQFLSITQTPHHLLDHHFKLVLLLSNMAHSLRDQRRKHQRVRRKLLQKKRRRRMLRKVMLKPRLHQPKKVMPNLMLLPLQRMLLPQQRMPLPQLKPIRLLLPMLLQPRPPLFNSKIHASQLLMFPKSKWILNLILSPEASIERDITKPELSMMSS